MRNVDSVSAPRHHVSLATAVCVYSLAYSLIGLLWCATVSLRPGYDVNRNNRECPFRFTVPRGCVIFVCLHWHLPCNHIQGLDFIDVNSVSHGSSAWIVHSHASSMCFVCEFQLYCIPHGTKVTLQ